MVLYKHNLNKVPPFENNSWLFIAYSFLLGAPGTQASCTTIEENH